MRSKAARAGWQARRRKGLRDAKKIHGHCPECGKQQYTTRAAARAAAKELHRGEGLRAYPGCRAGFFHIGHLPAWKKQGRTA